MSVYTTADEKIDKARIKLKETLKLISEVIDNEVWGYEDLSS